jgi:hypothetical protein
MTESQAQAQATVEKELTPKSPVAHPPQEGEIPVPWFHLLDALAIQVFYLVFLHHLSSSLSLSPALSISISLCFLIYVIFFALLLYTSVLLDG